MRKERLIQLFGLRNLSLLYVGFALIVLFAIWTPDTWLTSTTWKTILNEQAITALIALALIIPLSAGGFDLSIGWTLGLGAILVAWLIGEHGVPVIPAVMLTLLAGLIVGLVNGALVIFARIDSFIATLGVGSILAAVITMISGQEQIIGMPESFEKLASGEIGGVALPVLYLLLVAVIVWYVLEHTPVGRRVYATGGGPDAARLSGIRTGRILFCAFVVGALIASFSGLVLTSRLTAGSPDVGPTYLLPAFAAAFLGSTQVVPGRFNVWGTLLAVYVLAIGVKGLQLVGAASWGPDLFNGLALIIAVGLSGLQTRPRWWGRRKRELQDE